ncbi:UNVERIFIED_CONTAM: hypothetical protein FKN15_068091 [Acipenser sinensis]
MPHTIKVAVAGDHSYLSTILRFFVEQLANKTPDWLNYIRFLVIPIGCHPLAKYLASFDSKFNNIFMDAAWREIFSKTEPPTSENIDIAGRISQYIAGANVSHQFPISEAMLTYKQKSPDEDSCQKFIPFIGVVKVGIVEQNLSASGGIQCTTSCTVYVIDLNEFAAALAMAMVKLDSDDATVCNVNLLTSPPASVGSTHGKEMTGTPPPSPSVSSGLSGAGSTGNGMVDNCNISLFLQVDSDDATVCNVNLLTSPPASVGSTHGKEMTGTPPPSPSVSSGLSGAGIKWYECSLHALFNSCLLFPTVSIDGVEWNDVKFFQLAAQWPTHVKHFPVGILGYTKPV